MSSALYSVMYTSLCSHYKTSNGPCAAGWSLSRDVSKFLFYPAYSSTRRRFVSFVSTTFCYSSSDFDALTVEAPLNNKVANLIRILRKKFQHKNFFESLYTKLGHFLHWKWWGTVTQNCLYNIILKTSFSYGGRHLKLDKYTTYCCQLSTRLIIVFLMTTRLVGASNELKQPNGAKTEENSITLLYIRWLSRFVLLWGMKWTLDWSTYTGNNKIKFKSRQSFTNITKTIRSRY